MKSPACCILLVGIVGTGSVLAQDESKIGNWPAPPYWSRVSAPRDTSGSPGAQKSFRIEPESAIAATATPLPFVALPPCRLIDTRSGSGFPPGYGPPSPTAGSQRTFGITGKCGILADAQAVSFNFTVWGPVTRGDIRVYPAGGAVPAVSSLNWEANILALANAAVVPLGTGGGITVQVDGTGTIDLIVDVNGYYSPLGVVNTVNGLSGDVTLAQGSNVTISKVGQTLTIAAAGAPGPPGPPGPSGWGLTGNSGTTPPTNFLGTTDAQPMEVKVNGVRGLRIEPTAEAPNIIGGLSLNSITAGVKGGTIGGGGGNFNGLDPGENKVWADFGTIGGGAENSAGNGTQAIGSTVGGGLFNSSSERGATVGGGESNRALGSHATVGGGGNNSARGLAATVPGGGSNAAGGDYSFAAGRNAVVRDAGIVGNATGDQGTFVWADSSQLSQFISTGPNQFLVRAAGGVGINKNNPAAGALDVNGQVIASSGVSGTNAGAFAAGVAGFNATTGGYGVFGQASGTGGVGVYGYNPGGLGYAGYFNGNVYVSGSLSKPSGSFKIDHPLDPENKYLYHSFVESPDMMNIYNGNVTTDEKGYATVELPEWFEALNRDFRYQLTVIDEADGDGFVQAKVVKGVTSNRFTLRTSSPNARVSWQVTGIRKDAWAEKHRIPVEEIKPEGQRGWFLNPELFGRE